MNSTKYDELELTSLKYIELKVLCKKNGLKVSGKKVDLIKSLSCIPGVYEKDESDTEIYDSVLGSTACSKKAEFRPEFGNISEITSNPGCCFSSKNEAHDTLATKMKALKIQSIDRSSSDEENNGTLLLPNSEEQTLKEMAIDLQKKEELLDNLLIKFAQPAQAIFNLIESKKKELDESRQAGENNLQSILARKLMEHETLLKNQHREEIKKLEAEKLSSENYLKQQMSCLEKNKQNLIEQLKNDRLNDVQKTNKLQEENNTLQNNLETSTAEKSLLKSSIDELKEILENKDKDLKKQLKLMQAIEHNVKQNVLEIVKDELNCSICQELFVTAVNLPCSHSFCEMCLVQWFKTNKTCPVCRYELKMKAYFSNALNSVVESIIEKSDSDEKHRRTILLRERNELKRRTEAETSHQGIKNMFFKVSDIIAISMPSTNTTNTQSGATASFNNRRRSRSQSPARSRQIPAPAGNRFNYRIRCYNCGENHHIRNCPGFR